MLAEFPDARAAVEGAKRLLAAFEAASNALELPVSKIRCAVHRGRFARASDGSLTGDSVDVASVLIRASDPGVIVVSQSAADGLDDALELEELEPAHVNGGLLGRFALRP